MRIHEALICPECHGAYFTVKRETTYLYSYKLETPNTENITENDLNLPYLFDNREQISNKEYLQCDECGEKYSYDLKKDTPNIHFTILQKAIRSDYVNNPEFFG